MTMTAKRLEGSLRSRRALLVSALCLCTAGCRTTYVDPGDNRLPVAVARAIDPQATPVDSSANDGLGPIFPSDGEAIEIVLDGKASHDLDGTVVSYQWLSATKSGAGAGREVAPGEEPNWPEDVPQPRVKLEPGTWSFSLWVTDDEGAVSDPDTITLIVGEPPEAERLELPE